MIEEVGWHGHWSRCAWFGSLEAARCVIVLGSVESGDLVLKLISPLRPGLIEAADGTGFLYLIMPIRLNV